MVSSIILSTLRTYSFKKLLKFPKSSPSTQLFKNHFASNLLSILNPKNNLQPFKPIISGHEVIVINGYQTLEYLRLKKKLVRCKEYLAVMMIPVIENTFAYTICCLSKNNFIDHHYGELFKFCIKACKEHNLRLVGITGDGDSSFRKYICKTSGFIYVPAVDGDLSHLTDLIIPPDHFFNKQLQFMGEDFLHGGKKLRNALRACSARLLMFGEDGVASWHGIYSLWLNEEICKKVCIKSAVDCKDRQDPSLVYEISKLHIVLTDTEESRSFLSLYLEMMMFLFEAYLEHDLDILDRVFRIWYVRSFLQMWRYWAKKCLGVNWKSHFLADQTYVDTNIICDSFIAMLLHCHQHDLWFCPHYYSSDHCEQGFSYCRIHRHKGRKTNLSGSDAVCGLARRNRCVEVESYVHVLKPQPVAHARSRNIMRLPKSSTFNTQKARSVGSVEVIVDTMNDATHLAAHTVAKLKGVTVPQHYIQAYFSQQDEGHLRSTYKLDIAGERLQEKLENVNVNHGNASYVNIDDSLMHVDTCMAIYGNGGHTKLPSASRASRFFGYVFHEVALEMPCQAKTFH